jgi:hypothetical protein
MVFRERLSRVVWFRVSPDEYKKMSEFCTSSGRGSISDLSRCAVKWFVRQDSDPPKEVLATEVHKLRAQLQELNARLERLNLLLAGWKESEQQR